MDHRTRQRDGGAYVNLGGSCHLWHSGPGGWGFSNAGLVVGRGESLLVDTLYDLRTTRRMLDGFAACTREAPIHTVVNTHGNGDHWFGNQLVRSAEIIAAEGSVQDMHRVGPREMMELLTCPAPAGPFAQSIFGAFDFTSVRPAYPTRTFRRQALLDVGGVDVELIDVGPAHTLADTVVYVPHARVVYTGDIIFAGETPVVWSGPFLNWVAACDRLLALDVDVIVPGHGPVTDRRMVRETRDYLEYVYGEAESRFRSGMPAQQAARDIDLGRFAAWGEPERLAVNVHTVYLELAPGLPPLDGQELFGCMAELTQSAS